MIENRVLVANILDDCAHLLQLVSGEDDPAQTFHTIGYVEGRLAAAADAVRADDTRTLGHIATSLDGAVSRGQTQKELAERDRPAYDQNEHDESAWCIECGQVCGHAGHRHAQGDQGTTVCEQCGVTLDETT